MGDRDEARAVQRAVDQLEAGGLAQARADLACLNGSVQGILAVIAHKADEAILHALCKRDVLSTGQHIGLLDLIVHDGSSVIGHLAAIRAVSLVAVVLGRVVGSRDHDARVAIVVTGGKAQGRNRHQSIINAHLDAVGCQNTGSGLGKDITLEAAVIADGHRLGAALGLDPVCQALRGLTDHINIHPVGAGAQNAAQTGGAKFQCNRKAVFDLIVVSLNLCQLGLQVSVLKIRCQPALILFLIHVAHLTFIVFCRENGSLISLIII